MTSRTNQDHRDPNRPPKEAHRARPLERRRQQAIARYLDGDPIEAICREMGCSKSWLYKWKNRYQAGDPTWAQEVSRRPATRPAKLSPHLEAEIVRLRQASLSTGARPASAAAIRQTLEGQGTQPVPSRRTIYRVLQRHEKEVTDAPLIP